LIFEDPFLRFRKHFEPEIPPSTLEKQKSDLKLEDSGRIPHE
jgi:hypothetical protein